MFRSARREIVFPQAEHARLAATIALHWGNELVAPPPLPPEAFVAGVALHDRGYAPVDADGIGEVPPERWLEIQRESFRPRNEDPIVDLVVAMHIRRLIGYSRNKEAADELADTVHELRERAGVTVEDAEAADLVTNICDRIAFDFCFERPDDGALDVPAQGGHDRIRVSYSLPGDGMVTIDPWPLDVPRLAGVLFAFAARGYPERLEQKIVPYELVPSSA